MCPLVTSGVYYTDTVIYSTASIYHVDSNTIVLSDPTSSNYTKLSPTLDSNGTDLLQIKSVNIETGEDTQVQRLEVNSILSGINPTASAPGAATFGINNIATNTGSFVEGVGTLASGFAAHAAGFNTTSSGYAAFSVGVETDADGTASFAAGSGSWARGTATVAMGIGTVASSSGQLVVGHYNETKTDINNIFVVGDGTGPLSVNRRNIIEVYGGQGALFRGVKIDTATTPTITTTINGFNVYGQTYLRGNTDILTNKITSTGDTTLGTSGSIIFEAYNSLPALEGRTVMDWKGINFDDAFGTTSPGSTYLWRNNIVNHLYYGSSQLIQDGGNNTSTVANPLIIGTTNASNLELETNNTTRIFISSSGRVGIGTSSPTNTLQVVGGITATSITASIISASSGITGSLFGTSSWAVSASQALTASFLNGAFLQNGNSFGATAVLGTNDNQDLQFETNGSVRMIISSSGNIGIGTTPTSSFRLNVSGSARFGSGSVGFASGLGQIHAVDRTGAYITATQTTSSIVTFMGADNNGGIVGTYSNNDFSIRNNNTDKILLQGINVGIQIPPLEWIHLSSEPVGSKYLQIDAAQASNNPPFYAPGGGNTVSRVWGNIGDDYVLGTPDYWMEIKLDGTVVLIPCYTPTP